MGGQCWKSRITADYSVFFLTEIKAVNGPIKYKRVNYKFVTESFFNWLRLDDNDFVVVLKS
jgi:hypothetical protein